MYGILCVMLDLHVPKIIAYLIELVVLLFDPSSFSINSIQETSILEGGIMEISLACLIRFLRLRVIFC